MTSPNARNLRTEMQNCFRSGDIFERALRYGKEYLRESHGRNVAPTEEAASALAAFREPLPEGTGDAAAVLDMLHERGSPGTVAQIGGRFFGLVNGGVVPVGLAARILADAWDQNAALHAVSPVNAALEETCQEWLRDLFGLPKHTVAGFVSGSSMATVCGLAAARWRLCARSGYDINEGGLAGAPRIRIVAGRHAHSTVFKAIALLGFGTENVERAEVDEQGRIRLKSLPTLDDMTILILQAGNVNSGAFDPIAESCRLAHEAGSWVHIDGAFGLWAAACASLSHLTSGLERAQSWSVDAHKTLNAPYDSGISLCADPKAMVVALQNSGDYIVYSEERDGMLFTPEMSRRARVVDLWATMKYLGRSGMDEMVLSLHERAKQFAAELHRAGFDVVNEVAFNQVMIRIGDRAATSSFVENVRKSGEAWVGGSCWFGRPVVRISVCSWATTPGDVSRAVRSFVSAREGRWSKAGADDLSEKSPAS